MENLKLDLMDYEEDFNNVCNNLEKAINLLEESVKVTKGKTKYESNKLIDLCRKMYNFKIP